LNPVAPSRTDPAAAAAPRKILLIRFRRIGDIILTTPAVSLLKRHFPEAALTYLVEEPFRRLVEGNPALDRILVVPAKQSRREFAGLVRAVRRERFDVLLDLHGGPRASWITLFSRAGLKIGHGIKGKGFLYDTTVPRRGLEEHIHSVETHAGLVAALGARFDRKDIPPLFVPLARPEEAKRAADLVASAGAARLVVLHIGAGNAFRDWGPLNIAALAAKLAARAGVKIALIGGAADAPREREVLAAVPSAASIIPLAGRLNLIETRELVARAGLYIGPDSGPMHLAASTGTPIVALFGPTLPAHFAPWRPGSDPGRTVIVEKGLDCRPCRQRECVKADFRCLRSMTPDEVFDAARPFL
jgi:heptosyltransferase-1